MQGAGSEVAKATEIGKRENIARHWKTDEKEATMETSRPSPDFNWRSLRDIASAKKKYPQPNNAAVATALLLVPSTYLRR